MDAPAQPSVIAADYTLENEYLQVIFNPDTGRIDSFLDKTCAHGGLQAVLWPDLY